MYGKQHKKLTLLVTGSWLGSTNPALFPGSHTSERANLVSHYIWHVLGSGQWALTCDSVSAYTWVFSAFTTYYTSSWPHRARFERGHFSVPGTVTQDCHRDRNKMQTLFTKSPNSWEKYHIQNDAWEAGKYRVKILPNRQGGKSQRPWHQRAGITEDQRCQTSSSAGFI